MSATRGPAAVIDDAIAKDVSYIPRKLWELEDGTVWTDLQLLEQVRLNAIDGKPQNIMLKGPTGTGKTLLLRKFSELRDMPVLTVTPSDLAETAIGTMIVDPTRERAMRWVGGPIFTAAFEIDPDGPGAILYFDEPNILPPEIRALFYGLLDARRQVVLTEHPFTGAILSDDGHVLRWTQGEVDETGQPWRERTDWSPWAGQVTKRLPDNVIVAAAYNPSYEGTYSLNEAFKNRWHMTIQLDYNPEVEAALIPFRSVRKLGKLLRSSVRIRSEVPTNLLELLAEHLEYLPVDAALDLFVWRFEADEQPFISELLDKSLRHEITAEVEAVS